MTSLASLWVKSGMHPGTFLLAALLKSYRSLSTNAEDEAVKEEATTYYSAMRGAVDEANKRKWRYIKFYYSYLGKLNEQEIQKNYSVRVGRLGFNDLTSLARTRTHSPRSG